MLFVAGFESFNQGVSATNGGSQVLCVPCYLVETEIAIAVRTYDMWFDVIFPMETPTGVAQVAWIRRCVGYLRPSVAFGREAVGKFVVHEVLQKRQRPRISGVRIQTFHETFRHRSQVAC